MSNSAVAYTQASELPFVFKTFTRLLSHSTDHGSRVSPSVTYPDSRNAEILRELFSDIRNREIFFCRSFLFDRARGPPRPGELERRRSPDAVERYQQSSKLHCLYGVPILNHGRTRSSRMYPFACSKVYDIREYTDNTKWGPFMDDDTDRVDWEKVEAIMIVLRANIQNKGLDNFPIFTNFLNTPFPGTWPNSYIPMPLNREITPLETGDPYDVSGTWLRVCSTDRHHPAQ